MKIFSKNHSSYPRIGDAPEQQRLRRAYHRLDSGQIDQKALESILNETITIIIKEQIESGVDYVTDGLLRSYDPVSYIASKIDGFGIGGLLRFFDTNFYYRQPELKDVPSAKGELVCSDFKFTKEIAGSKASLTMMGPFSLLKLSKVNIDFETALESVASIYGQELAKLKKIGASIIQIDEPALLTYPKEIGSFRSAYSTIASNFDCPELMLAFYFGDCTSIIDELDSIPVSGFVFDFTYSTGLADRLQGFRHDLGIGLVDCRNTLMENTNTLTEQVESILARVKSKKIYLTPSCGLEFLPRERAYQKLKLCADLANIIRGGASA